MIRLVDPTVIAFTRVVAMVLVGVLAAIGVVAIARRDRNTDLTRELWLRWRSWVVMATTVLAALALGRLAWVGLVAVLALLAFREYAAVVGVASDRALLATGVVLIAATFVTAAWPAAAGAGEAGWYGLFVALPVWATVAILLVAVVRDRFEASLRLGGAVLIGVLTCGWLLGHLAYLANRPGGGLVLFVVFLSAVNDVAAFCVGKLAGRHPLRPRLSPRKTIEGAVGAAAVVMVVGWSLRWLVPGCGGHALMLAAIIAAAGTAGDLAFSAIKRDAGVKDWSAVVPGHGGVLDRLNGLILTAPVVFHYIRFFEVCS